SARGRVRANPLFAPRDHLGRPVLFDEARTFDSSPDGGPDGPRHCAAAQTASGVGKSRSARGGGARRRRGGGGPGAPGQCGPTIPVSRGLVSSVSPLTTGRPAACQPAVPPARL